MYKIKKYLKSKMLKNKDIDREILLKLKNDREIITLCHSDRYFFFKVCDDEFFHRRLREAYPDLIKLNLKMGKENWKRFYMRMMYYIFKMKEENKYEYTEGNPIVQADILRSVPRNARVNLLINAARGGEIALVKEAIRRRVSKVGQEDALLEAIEHGHLKIVKYLIENQKVDVHLNEEGPLQMAAYKGLFDIAKYLISKGAVPNERIIQIAHNYGHDNLANYLSSL